MIEHIKIEHNKKITILISLIHFIIATSLVACVTLIGIHFEKFSNQIGVGSTVLIMVVLALCSLLFFFLLVNQVIKLRHKYIFIADENGICDYSRFIVLKPISYNEIGFFEYKEFDLLNTEEASDLRHLKIILKDKHSYMRKLNPIQRISLFFEFSPIELHLFCGKSKVKDIAMKLKQNLDIYNEINKS